MTNDELDKYLAERDALKGMIAHMVGGLEGRGDPGDFTTRHNNVDDTRRAIEQREAELAEVDAAIRQLKGEGDA